MARSYDEYLMRGAAIAAIVTDHPAQNAAMVSTLALPFPVLSDANGEGAIKPYGVWDDAGAMSKPAIIVLSPEGNEVFRYVGIDFMDRPHEDDALAALAESAFPAVDRPLATAPHMSPTPGPRAMPLRDLAVYMRGVRFATQALANRARDPFDRDEAQRTAKMAERFIAAQAATRRVVDEG